MPRKPTPDELDGQRDEPYTGPGRKSTKCGSRSVSERQTIGSGRCWCGATMGHDWPGKAEGEAHPPAVPLEEPLERAKALIVTTNSAPYAITAAPSVIAALVARVRIEEAAKAAGK